MSFATSAFDPERTSAFGQTGRLLVADYAARETGKYRCQGRQPRTVCHFPDGGSCRAEGIIPKNPPPHRWAAAGPFAAMTATHPVASRSPDRTGVCCAGRSAPSQCEMATAPRFSSQNQPDQERPQPIVTTQGRNCGRMPILLPSSAIGRSHMGNPS